MKILLIGDKEYRQLTVARLVESKITISENIIQISESSEAKAFFLNNVIGQKKEQHLDLIILNDNLDENHPANFCSWLKSIDESYSDSNFRVSSIPIILFKKDIGEQEYLESKYDKVLPVNENEYDDRLILYCKEVTKKWRDSIFEDLETLKIDLEQLKFYGSDFNLINSNYKSISDNLDYYYSITTIMSNEFIQNPKMLNYDWFSLKTREKIEKSLYEYESIIKMTKKFNNRYFEQQVLHKFYNNYPHFLCRDTYENQLHEQRFYISTTSHFHRPDFILTSPFPGYTPTSISEIKRHNIYFQYKPHIHHNFTDYFQNALNQASNYEDDFTSGKNYEYLIDKFGYNFVESSNNLINCKIDLIIGLDDRMADFTIKKLSKHFPSINITTHDLLLQQVEDYLQRLYIY